jgi:hypothetical protein
MRFAPCTRRRGARVSYFSLKTKVDCFSRFGLKTGSYGSCGLTSKPLARVSDLGLKIGSCGFMIWPTKSPGQFPGLGVNTKWTKVYQLHHKTERRMKKVRDLAACFAWKQVRLGFPSIASRLAEARHGWCTWHHHRGRVEMMSKTVASDSSALTLSLSLY